VFLAWFASLAGVQAATATAPALISAQRIVAVENVCAWPILVTLRDGTIISIIHNQPSHGQQEGEIEAWASRDGVTWAKRGRPAPNDPNTVRMNVGAGLDRNGDLIVLCSGWSNIKHRDRPKQPVFRDSTVETWVCRSKDGGRTWTQQKRFVPARPGWLDYIPFGPVITGDDGALHAACYSGEFRDPTTSTRTKGYRAWHFRSDDNGVTWRETAPIGDVYSETALLHLGGKRWLAAARTVTTDVLRSDDDGASWTKTTTASERLQIPAHLMRLKDGRLLLSYGSRVPEKLGVFAKTSSDEGNTWSAPVYIAAMLETDGGYPSSVQRADGKVVTAYYAKRVEGHDGYHMGVAIWSAPAK
jgi:Neuraminidase (sialidase)